jgi:ribosomal protein S18 acetylase RimI-like enzyme
VTATVQLRPGKPADAANIVLLVDMAGRGLLNWFWSSLSDPGESAFARGRSRIRNNPDLVAYCQKWAVAEIEGDVAGACTGYLLEAHHTDDGDISDVYAPAFELEAMVEGSWFLMALAVFPEHRRKGMGSTLLADAEKRARNASASLMSLLVQSVNTDAVLLYQASGFREVARRAYIPFPGSRDDGDWILFTKEVAK